VVVEEEPRALHRGELAERGAEAIVELAGVGRGVDLGDQLDQNVDRVGTQRWGGGADVVM